MAAGSWRTAGSRTPTAKTNGRALIACTTLVKGLRLANTTIDLRSDAVTRPTPAMRAVMHTDTPGLRREPPAVETNSIWVRVDPEMGSVKDVVAALEQRGVRVMGSRTHMLRACTHLHVSVARPNALP